MREIKILDPACGSGHFLVYAFNVLFWMYLEDEPETPREEIPRLILENNLFGIDIDLRSVQLAALSLYLKAKEYSPGVKIERMNLVCADVRILDGDLKKGFLKSLEPDVDFQRIFAKLFDELEYTYDIGSLLKVREPFERLLRERGPIQARWHIRPKGQAFFSMKGELSAQAEMSSGGEREVVPVNPAVTLGEMLEALEAFEREGMEKKDMGTMLFAAEAEKSVGLLSLLSQKYDVVVMNPPYGDMPENTKKYTKEHYPRTHYDYYAAFIEQAVALSQKNGFIGMLTGRTFMFLKWFEKVRTEILLKEARPEIFFDLNSSPGDNILDEATARWAATVARKYTNDNEETECIFIRLTLSEGEEKKIEALEESISNWMLKGEYKLLYLIKLKSLRKLPRMPYSYWIPVSLVELFDKFPPFDRDNSEKQNEVKIADLKQGLATADNSRFVRYWWEVNKKDIALNKTETLKGKKWVPFAKGGGAYYSDILMVVNWNNDGMEIKDFPKSVVRNEDYYFKPGLCWSRVVSSICIDMRPLPNGSIFSVAALAAFPHGYDNWSIIAVVNSSLVSYLFLAINPTQHDRHLGYIATLPIPENAISDKKISSLCQQLYNKKRLWDTGNEVSTIFKKPWILQINRMSTNSMSKNNLFISELSRHCINEEIKIKFQIIEFNKLLDETVYDLYGVSSIDREIINNELINLKGYTPTSKDDYKEDVKSEVPIEEHIIRLISYYVKLILEENHEGIVELNDMVDKIRQYIVKDFGKEKLGSIENEITTNLDKTLKAWLSTDFFNFHVSLYERRPIFWQISSSNFSRKRGSKSAFNCFLHYHKLDRDTIPKIRARQEYLKGVLDGARWRSERLRRELQTARESGDKSEERRLQREYEVAMDVYGELQTFDQKLAEVSSTRERSSVLAEGASWVERKIAEVRDNGWSPVMDYGVRVNIEPLKEARLLHKAADRVK